MHGSCVKQENKTVERSASVDTALYGKALQKSIQKPNAAHKMSAITVDLINDL
jgi:hypothetical protein